MSEYKIGQILTAKKECELELGISGRKIKIPKGNKIIIGADKLGHHIKTGRLQPLQKEDTVKGYDTKGLAEYLYIVMNNQLPLQEMLDGEEITKEECIEAIEEALDEIL